MSRPRARAGKATLVVVLVLVLPTWAQAGFTPPTQAMPHVLGVRDNSVAILFGQPLRSPLGRHRVGQTRSSGYRGSAAAAVP